MDLRAGLPLVVGALLVLVVTGAAVRRATPAPDPEPSPLLAHYRRYESFWGVWILHVLLGVAVFAAGVGGYFQRSPP